MCTTDWLTDTRLSNSNNKGDCQYSIRSSLKSEFNHSVDCFLTGECLSSMSISRRPSLYWKLMRLVWDTRPSSSMLLLNLIGSPPGNKRDRQTLPDCLKCKHTTAKCIRKRTSPFPWCASMFDHLPYSLFSHQPSLCFSNVTYRMVMLIMHLSYRGHRESLH